MADIFMDTLNIVVIALHHAVSQGFTAGLEGEGNIGVTTGIPRKPKPYHVCITFTHRYISSINILIDKVFNGCQDFKQECFLQNSSQRSCESFQCNEMIFNAQNELQFKLAQVRLTETEKSDSHFLKYK